MNVTLHIPAGIVAVFTTYFTTRTLATLLNVFFWYKNPDDWASFVENQKRLSILVRFSRAWGIDWRKGLRLIRAFTATFRKQGFPLPEAQDVVVVTTEKTTTTVTMPATPAAPPVDPPSTPG